MSIVSKILCWLKDIGTTQCPECNKYTFETSTFLQDGKCNSCCYSETVQESKKREKDSAKSA